MPVTRHSPPRANSPPTPRPRSRQPSRNFMIRIILFLALIAAAGAGAAWVADQPGNVVLSWGGTTSAEVSLAVFTLFVGIAVLVGMFLLWIVLVLLRTPARMRRRRHERRHARGRH